MQAIAILKVCTLMGSFYKKYVMFKLKEYRGFVSWKMAYGFNNNISNLVNFHTRNWKYFLVNPLYKIFYQKKCIF